MTPSRLRFDGQPHLAPVLSAADYRRVLGGLDARLGRRDGAGGQADAGDAGAVVVE
ncbi:MAG TPA: hypothetical protein VH352_01180 [Pseudonocardiaceae bacterium]|nr:hypothetical protein [Pseudonocardiaceae bacterium]